MKKILSLILILTLIITIAGPSQTVSAATNMRFNKSAVLIGYSETFQLKILDIPTEYKKVSVKWSSENSKIASVSKAGLITGKSKGKTKIKAIIGKKTLTCTVNIRPSSKNITDAINDIKVEYCERGDIVCILSNTTNIDIAFECKITFYKDGSPVSLNKIPTFIFANSKQVISFNKTEKAYDSYNVTFSKNNMVAPKNLNSKVSVDVENNTYDYYPNPSDSNTKEKINLIDLSMENNTDDLANIYAYVAYFKDNKIVYVQNFINYGTLDIGNTKIYNPFVAWQYRTNQSLTTNAKLPDYDNYEIIYSAFK